MRDTGQVRVWDPLVRLFHWSLVAAFATAWLSGETGYETHRIAGYTVLGLCLARFVWGLVGTTHARFTDFVVGPSTLTRYLVDLGRGRAPRFIGHNPAGGAMILALLAVLAVISVSGVMLDAAENRAGPLKGFRLFLYTDIIESVHELSTDLAVAPVLLHLIGVAHASIQHRENLVRAMITGRKEKG